MMTPTVVGAFIVGLPAILIAILLFWRRLKPVFWFALALIVVGIGYLVSTGATADVANYVMG